ncbi:hypothetical protein DPMN_168079 [Dreissena polymorpha]|uniref:Uncharacterized protein n=1 Tax=Dreissena polymorpha TaxID=45954 RepID=A0A9D4IWW9_DREPO|nr:hypothetical protein DPMN_168079 [Dreissena polymorpha]
MSIIAGDGGDVTVAVSGLRRFPERVCDPAFCVASEMALQFNTDWMFLWPLKCIMSVGATFSSLSFWPIRLPQEWFVSDDGPARTAQPFFEPYVQIYSCQPTASLTTRQSAQSNPGSLAQCKKDFLADNMPWVV